MPPQLRILVVEDTEDIQEFTKFVLGKKYEVISAYTLEAGERAIAENNDFVAILVDACVPGKVSNSGPFIAQLKRNPEVRGLIVGLSSTPLNTSYLMGAGCDQAIVKDELVKIDAYLTKWLEV